MKTQRLKEHALYWVSINNQPEMLWVQKNCNLTMKILSGNLEIFKPLKKAYYSTLIELFISDQRTDVPLFPIRKP